MYQAAGWPTLAAMTQALDAIVTTGETSIPPPSLGARLTERRLGVRLRGYAGDLAGLVLSR